MIPGVTDSFRRDILSLEGERFCVGVVSGSGTGSMVTLYLGERNERGNGVSFEGKPCLYLEDCSWRVEDSSHVLASSISPNEEGDFTSNALKTLIGKRLLKVAFWEPSHDLVLEFEEEIRLIVFCLFNPLEEMDNYTFFFEKCYYTCSFSCDLKRSLR